MSIIEILFILRIPRRDYVKLAESNISSCSNNSIKRNNNKKGGKLQKKFKLFIFINFVVRQYYVL